MSDQGILVFGPSMNPKGRDVAYDSRKGRLQTSLIIPANQPPHLAIIPDIPGGSAWSSSSGGTMREVLFPIKHNLPYTPEVLVYLYVQSYGGSTVATQAGSYGTAIFYSGTSGTVEDKIFWEVDDQELRLVHTLTNFAYPGTFVSDADKYLLRLKYYILSNKSHVKSYSPFGTIL